MRTAQTAIEELSDIALDFHRRMVRDGMYLHRIRKMLPTLRDALNREEPESGTRTRLQVKLREIEDWVAEAFTEDEEAS